MTLLSPSSSSISSATTAITATTNAAASTTAATVLTNRALWSLITAFQTGYPFPVRRLEQQGDAAELMRRIRVHLGLPQLLGGRFERRGQLAYFAIAAGDVAAFRMIHALAQLPHYQQDEKLDQSCVMRFAILYNRIEILECIAALKARELESVDVTTTTTWEPNLMALAITMVDSVDVAVLDWLQVHVPHEVAQLPQEYLLKCMITGRLDVVQWLCARRCKLSQRAVDYAALFGHAHVLAYLYTQTYNRCKATAVNVAASNGYLDVIKVVVAHQRRATTLRAINAAAEHGHMDIVTFLVDSGVRTDVPRVIDFAAKSGNLVLVKYLHERFPTACTFRALDNAAMYGHVDVAAFLLEHRSEGSPASALRFAVEFRRIDVVRLLHPLVAPGECPPSVFDLAASRGHLEVVQFLHAHRTEGCTSDALNWAAKHGRLEVVQFLCENRTEGDVEVALKRAAGECHFAVVEYLHGMLRPDQSAFPALALTAFRMSGRITGSRMRLLPTAQRIFAFLIDNVRPDESMRFRDRAASTVRPLVIDWIQRLERERAREAARALE